VIVGISGLRWSQVTPAAAPALWRLAASGSAGDLVGYAEHPVACPADGWLTLNSGARAAAPRPLPGGRCEALPPVVQEGAGARVPAMPQLIAYNAQFHENPDWGLLGRLASCSTAVGPGAALALAAPDGAVSGYVRSPAEMSAGTLARCPLTLIDLGQIPYTERMFPSVTDHILSHIVAELPPDTLLLVTAPGGSAAGGRPHLLTTVVNGPGYARGLLTAASTRRPGIVTLTDLTPTVARWLGRAVPGYLAGSVAVRGDRGPLAAAVRELTARDTAEQVWMSTHAWFFACYAALDALLLGVPAVMFWGAGERNRRRRAAGMRVAGVISGAVPVGTFLAGLGPWLEQSRPSVWLYGMSAGWTAVLAGLAFALTRRWRDPLAPAGAICLLTLGVLGADVMTGSRLQLETPFGLSLLEAGRYYGIGNNALGVYCVAALAGAAWLGAAALRWFPGRRRPAVLLAGAVGVFAVMASGWPGFGAKVGGTIAMVPCFALLLLALGGKAVRWRHAVPATASGLVLVTVLALLSYLVPAAGVSDIGAFFGNLLHGHGGAVLERKASSNLGTLTVSALSPLVPCAVVLAGLALWRPLWFRLRTLPLAFGSSPLLRVTAWLSWLVLVIGWLADDSGVIVPAAAMPFAVPLVAGMAASVYNAPTGYRGSTFAGSSVAGQPVSLYFWSRQAGVAVPAFAAYSRSRSAHTFARAAEGDRPGVRARGRPGDLGVQPPVGRRLLLPAAGDRPASGVPREGRVLRAEEPRRAAVRGLPEVHQPAADGPRRRPVRVRDAGRGGGNPAARRPVRLLPGGDPVAGRQAVPGTFGDRVPDVAVRGAGAAGRDARHQEDAAAGLVAAAADADRDPDREADGVRAPRG
jgi:hypothetical protein